MTILVAGASESVGDQQIKKGKKKKELQLHCLAHYLPHVVLINMRDFFFLFGRPKIFDRDPENFKQPS